MQAVNLDLAPLVPRPSPRGPVDSPDKLTTRGLTAHYGDVTAVRDIWFRAPQGQITAIIGPSGCGKTTLLRSLNRMNELIPGFRTEGEIVLDGQELTGSGVDLIAVRRRIGMIFQRPNPFPMSVFDNVAYGPRLDRRMARDELRARVEGALERVGLLGEVRDRLDRSALALSGGQQQRLCLARALAVEPDIVLLDEPTSALDPVAMRRIEELLCELRGEVTMIIVTHNLQQAARISDCTAFLNLGEGRAGRLVEQAATSELFRSPASKDTEDYITGRFG